MKKSVIPSARFAGWPSARRSPLPASLGAREQEDAVGLLGAWNSRVLRPVK